MWTKRITLIAVILALVAVLFSQEKAATNPSASGYQLIAAPVTVGPSGGQFSEQHRLFLVDSISGNVLGICCRVEG